MQEKKCPTCGKWNPGSLTNCSSCGGLLDKNELLFEARKKKGLIKEREPEGELFEIKPEYPWWRKGILYFIRPVYWIFFYIISGFVWLIAWVSA